MLAIKFNSHHSHTATQMQSLFPRRVNSSLTFSVFIPSLNSEEAAGKTQIQMSTVSAIKSLKGKFSGCCLVSGLILRMGGGLCIFASIYLSHFTFLANNMFTC